MPYKAVDGLVDQLARYLQGLPSSRRHACCRAMCCFSCAAVSGAAARGGSPSRARAPSAAPLDSLELRRRAATVLRELLSAVSDRCPLVLTIDDLQWGDLDSASLLHESSDPQIHLPCYCSRRIARRMSRPRWFGPCVSRCCRTPAGGTSDAGRRGAQPEQACDLAVRELASRAGHFPRAAMEIARRVRGATRSSFTSSCTTRQRLADPPDSRRSSSDGSARCPRTRGTPDGDRAQRAAGRAGSCDRCNREATSIRRFACSVRRVSFEFMTERTASRSRRITTAFASPSGTLSKVRAAELA